MSALDKDFLYVDDLLVDKLDDSNELLKQMQGELQKWMVSEDPNREGYLSTSVFSMTCADPQWASVLPVSSLRDGIVRQSMGSSITSDLALLKITSVVVNLPSQVGDDLFAVVARGSAQIKDSSIEMTFIRNMTVQIVLKEDPSNQNVVLENMFIISDQLHVLSLKGL